MTGLLDGVTDVNGLTRLERVIITCHAKGDGVVHLITLLVHEVELDVLVLLAHHLAGAGIIYLAGHKDGLAVARAIGIEQAQVTQQYLR